MNEATSKKLLSGLRNNPDALIDMIVRQGVLIEKMRVEIEMLRAENERLRKGNDDLGRRLETIERESHRQAAPFRVADKKRKKSPKKPGRKKGHKGAFRARPERVDETIEVPLTACPKCGGSVSGVTELEQFIEEIPTVRPRVTRLVTQEGRCLHCGPVRSTHPLQVSTASGAAAVQLGPNALGIALELDQRHGLSKRKTCEVLGDLFGLRLTPGGLVQAAHRMAGRLTGRFRSLEREARESAVLHADETSWWVGGPKWWLWVFTNPSMTLYRVRRSRGRDVIRESIGADYPGVLVSDCLNIYDGVSETQHKCYSHHLKAIKNAIECHPKGGEGFLWEVKILLKAAMGLKKAWPSLGERERKRARQTLKSAAQILLAPARGDPREKSIANRLRKQEDHLFTFLDHEVVLDATNNLAERQLRPAVIARKISCGNRTERGARTWEILASLSATLTQRQKSFRNLVAQTARLQPNST